MLWLLLLSLQRPVDIACGPLFLPFADFAPSIDAWRALLAFVVPGTVRPLANSVLVTLASTLATVVLAAPAAFALTGSAARRGNGLLLFLLAPRLLPPVSLAGGLYLMSKLSGLLDTSAALVLANLAVNLPVAIWLLRDTFAAIPREIVDAARVDGATIFGVFWRVALPLAQPGLAVAALVVGVLSWGEYPIASVLATDRAQTLPSVLVGMIAVREQASVAEPNIGQIAALVLTMAAPPLLAVAALHGTLVRWLTAR